MKFVRSVILIALMIVFCFQQWAVIIAFNFNQPYIAKNLCVNKKKPHSCCKGKCYLGKALQKNTDNSTEAKAPIKYKVEVFTSRDADDPFKTHYSVIETLLFPTLQHFTHQGYYKSAFHPPDLFV